MPFVPGAVHLFGLAIFFFLFSFVIVNLLTAFAVLPSSAYPLQSIGVGSLCSQMPPQNSTNFRILGILSSRIFTASRAS